MTSAAIMIEGCGKRLSEARTGKSLSVAEVAGQLKFGSRQIEAMEAEDWDYFPSRVTLRGFLRAYAQHLGLDPDSLFVVAESDSAAIDPLTPATTGILFSGNGVRLWLVILTLIAVFFALVMGLYAWLSQGADQPLQAEPPTQAAVGVASPDTAAIPAVVPPATTPTPTPTPTAAPTAAPAVAETPAVPAVQAPTPAATPAAVPAVTSKGSAKASGLVFTTTSDAWIEVTDATKQRISRLVRVGESTRIEGTPPYKLVVGNAAHVTLQYNHRAVDLKPFIGEKVARLNLE